MRTLRETPLLGDHAFSGLEDALDAGAMLERFRKRLRPAGEAGCEILACRLSRIRHRKGERCVLQYDLTVSGPDTKSERDVPVSGLMYAERGKAQRTWRKLTATEPDVPEAVLLFEPLSYLPDLGMLVYTFPYDRKIKGLGRLTAGPPAALELYLHARFGPGGWTVESWDTETIRYREGRGAVLRYAALARNSRTGESTEKQFYVKAYHDDTGERARQSTEDIAGVAGRSFDVVMPVVYLDDLRALVLEEAPGISLEQIFLRGGVVRASRGVARALADFNKMDVHPARRHALGDLVADLEKAAKTLRWACPGLTGDIERVIGAVVGGLEEVTPMPTHLDIKPDHVFLSGGHVTFIDLDLFAAADPVLDPAYLLARLAAIPYLFPVSRSRVLVAARAFADAYFSRVPASWRERLHLHYAAAILQVAHGFFRRQEAGWPEAIVALVNEARNAVDGHGLMELLDWGHRARDVG